ncbi:MAG: nuclear transport factor 2 family protein [Cyanobacteria bacterium]|nr:nuclear transport factor 2 family protein [Cyanobacteriota bacterium]
MNLLMNSKSKVCLLLISLLMVAEHAQSFDHSKPEKIAAETVQSVEKKSDQKIKIELVGAEENDSDKKDVVEALKKLLRSLAERDLDQVRSCLSPEVFTIDQRSGKFFYGKEDVLKHVKDNILGTETNHPVKRIAVYNPFISVKGDMAMVSFRATKDLGDKENSTLESLCSEVFERKNNEWLVYQLRTNWKKTRAAE